MSRPRTKPALVALTAAALLGGCSDMYFDRRESISLSAGDDVYANQVTHMVDPWPAHSANRNIAFDGERMQRAVERYRTNRTAAPQNSMTSSAEYKPPEMPALPAPAAK